MEKNKTKQNIVMVCMDYILVFAIMLGGGRGMIVLMSCE